jgi:hypothetical protein
MKKISFFITVLFLASFLAGCGGVTVSLGGSQATNSQTYPLKAVIDSPASGSNLAMGAVDIAYHASAQDGVAVVELSVNGQVVSNLVTPDSKQPLVALKYTWQPTASGTHIFRVRAQSSKGDWSPFAETMVTIQGEVQQQQQQQQQQIESPTNTPEPTHTPEPTNTPEPTSTPEGIQIDNIQKTANKFYWSAGSCGPVKLTFQVHVNQPKDVFQVLVFNRMWDREGAGSGGWDGGYAMKPIGDGEYSFTYTSTNTKNPKGFDRAEFHYQFKVVGKGSAILYSSDVFKDIQFDHCP